MRTAPGKWGVTPLFCYQAKKWIGSFAAALGGSDTLISPAASCVKVRVVRTDEELMIARSVCRVMGIAPAA